MFLKSILLGNKSNGPLSIVFSFSRSCWGKVEIVTDLSHINQTLRCNVEKNSQSPWHEKMAPVGVWHEMSQAVRVKFYYEISIDVLMYRCPYAPQPCYSWELVDTWMGIFLTSTVKRDHSDTISFTRGTGTKVVGSLIRMVFKADQFSTQGFRKKWLGSIFSNPLDTSKWGNQNPKVVSHKICLSANNHLL